jgi:carbon starvation protein CstA
MISLLISLAVLIAGYLVYGKITEIIFAPDDRQTPAVAVNDGVDCVPMKTWKSFLIQLLNIAGVFAAAVLFMVYLAALIRNLHGNNAASQEEK